MKKRRSIEVFSISFLDLLSGALGAVIILYVAIPKNNSVEIPQEDEVKEMMRREIITSQEEINDLKLQLKKVREKLAVKAAPDELPIKESSDLNIGFKFKGKNIVFIIDTSYSMIEESRIEQVKAGLKMFLTSLGAGFRIEIVQFPLGQRAPFRSMWGTTKDFQNLNRVDALNFIYSLRPAGGTPTRETLLFVLKNYTSITDIVLLTDGAPTLHNSNKKDDIFDILQAVRNENHRNVQINTIGVGSNFLSDKASEQYKFLSLLSSENDGFFVGF